MPYYGKELQSTVPIRDLLKAGLETKPDEDALVSLEKRYTWRELDDVSARLAANYFTLGLKPGDRIASLIPNRCELLIHYVACFKAGLVAVPLNYRYSHHQIDHALEVSEAQIILLHEERRGDAEKSMIAGNLPLGIISYGSNNGDDPRLEDLLQNEPGDADLQAPEPDRPAIIFFTSGSTGPSKGVTHSYESLEYMFASCRAGFELTTRDVMVADSSHSHLGGFLFSFTAMSAGGRVLVATNAEPDELLTLLRRQRPSVLCMLPAALFRIIRDHGATSEDFSSLRLTRSGSDKVPLELEHEFTALTGLQIDEGYGSTEVGLATINPPSGLIVEGSIGRPLPGFGFSIRDDEGVEVPTGKEGNLWVRSKSIMLGYWNNPESTAATIKDGWLDIGDVLKADEDGYLWFKGRKKQIIVHDGSNIAPQEVEEALLEHEAVESAGVIGIHDLLHGENVRAYVSIRNGADKPKATDLIAFARERIGYRAPEEIVFLDEIPLNPTGKVDRVTLKKMAEGDVR
ncbi:MAG: class I adenylate-forming enzyme family protein [Deltaproteobacteria bacterium]